MKRTILHIISLVLFTALSQAQESSSAIALELPSRNSLMFNRYILSPTFSYVKEDTKHLTINNKRELVQVENGPETYLASFSGRFSDKIGGGLGLFQRKFGVFTTFGGILNVAYNTELTAESNLTFGLNISAYSSGINTGSVITTADDPIINNISSSFITTISPGINYGTDFFDIGATLNNIATYNVSTSEMLSEETGLGIQGHLMYTGYLNSRGFFDNSKFSALARAEFRESATIYSGTIMLSVPKGIWIQGGYNTVYGASAGIGLNITSEIALEYNYEKSLGNFQNFGPSHELTLAYIIPTQSNRNFNKNEITGLLNFEKKRKKSYSKRSRLARNNKKPEPTQDTKTVTETEPESTEKIVTIQTEGVPSSPIDLTQQRTEEEVAMLASLEKEKIKDAARIKLQAQARENTRKAAAEKARLEAEALAKRDAEVRAQQEAQKEIEREAAAERARLEVEAQAKKDAEARAQQEVQKENERRAAAEQARLEAEAEAQKEIARRVAVEQARLEVEAQAKKDAEARAQQEEIERRAAAEQARLEAEAEAQKEIAKRAAAEQARLEVEAQAKKDAEAIAQQEAQEEIERRAAAEQARLQAEANAQPEIPLANDRLAISLQQLSNQSEAVINSQNNLLDRLRTAVTSKDQDLKDLKEENDLSEQGVYVEPRPFKSVSSENAQIESLKSELEESLNEQNLKITELENIYAQRLKATDSDDEINRYYQGLIEQLKEENKEQIKANALLISRLSQIKVATQFERSRRIKRASFKNEEDRFEQDQARLNSLKQNTPLNSLSNEEDSFDFGKERNSGIQILKNVDNTQNAYYLILAVHGSISKRDDFVKKVISSGYSKVNFFYDINTSMYYIYYDKSTSLEDANSIVNTINNNPYAAKISIVKIEN